jgi:hypothetical protein
MAKNSNSRLGTDIKLDKVRLLRWTHGTRSLLEDQFCDWANVGRGDTRFTADVILDQFLVKASVLQIAFRCALTKDNPELTIQEANDLLEIYLLGDLENDIKPQSIETLREKIQESYRIAFDPSSLASWRESLKNLKKKNETLAKLKEVKAELAKKKVEAEIEKAEKSLKNLTGEPDQPASPSSS